MRTPALALLPALLACGVGDGDDPAPFDDEGLFDIDDDDAATGDPVALPGSFATTCEEVEPNDPTITLGELRVPSPPWESATDCGLVSGPGEGLIRMSGSIADIVEGSWDGDRDTFRFTVAEAATPHAVMQWDPLQGDLDAQVQCDNGDGSFSRLFGSGLSSAEVPETADAAFELRAGATCWVFVTGFAGRVAGYDLWLE